VFGDIREYPLDTPVETILGLNRLAKDFEILEYKEVVYENSKKNSGN
jgi:hypothetical protein